MTDDKYRASANIAPNVIIGDGVVFAGSDIQIQQDVRIDAASVLGEAVTIGRGAWIRPGSVVLRSVPANSIVEGNPAEVVGYVASDSDRALRQPRLIDLRQYADAKRPTKIDLGIGGCSVYAMRSITDPRGALTVGEVGEELPFTPARYFAVYDVPSVELRGEHAHKECQQFLLCIHGSCRILLDDGNERCELTLDRPDYGVFMPPMVWGTQYRYSADAVLMVFASHSYDADDYLRTYEEFLVEKDRRGAS